MFNNITKSTGGQQSANAQFCSEDGKQKWGNISMSSGGPNPYPPVGGPPVAVQPLPLPVTAFDTLNCDVVYEMTLTEL